MSVRPAGYTLLEMIVVMAIVAMATAVAAPPSYRMIRSWQDATAISDVVEQLAQLPRTARSNGTPITAEAGPFPEVVTLPEDWSLTLSTPLKVQANGLCSDANALLQTSHQSIALTIQAPFCRVERQP